MFWRNYWGFTLICEENVFWGNLDLDFFGVVGWWSAWGCEEGGQFVCDWRLG
jgi:hypothetical protein